MLINRNIKNMREAFDLLETEGLIRMQNVQPKQIQAIEKCNTNENEGYQYCNMSDQDQSIK